MEAEVVDSLWEIGRQDQDFHHAQIVITRSVWQEGQYGIFDLYFNTLQDLVEYFKVEEVGDGVYDPQDMVIAFSYDQPTGPLYRMYAFFRENPFDVVVNALGDQVTSVELDTDISRKVMDDLDPGFYPPSVITGEVSDEELPEDSRNITLQDFTDASLVNFNRLISTDLNKPVFGTDSPAMTTPDYLKPGNEDKLRLAVPSTKSNTPEQANGKGGCPCKNKLNNPLAGNTRRQLIRSSAFEQSTKANACDLLSQANAYTSQDVDAAPLQTITTQNGTVLFNEYDQLMRDHGETEPGGVAPRPDLSLGVAELRDDPYHPSLVGRHLSLDSSRYQRPLSERSLFNTPSFRSWRV